MVLKQQASTIQSRPVKNIRKVGKKEENEANCTNLFTCNCKITTDNNYYCFKCRTSHELNFNTRFQLPSSLCAFDAVYQGDSKLACETSNTQTALIGSIYSDERNLPFLCADAQLNGLVQEGRK